MTTPAPDLDDRWHRLDARSTAAVAVLVAAPLAPTAVIMLLSGASTSALLTTVGIWLAATVALSAAAATSWYFTYYRLTDERFEMRAGNLSRSHRSIPRDRIRSVDLTAQPVHRLFGLSVVKIGTAQQSGENSEVKLDAVATGDAELLRSQLLRHDHTPAGGHARSPATPVSTGQEIARLNPAWLGYSALTLSLALIVWGALASGIGSFSELLVSLGVASRVRDVVVSAPLWLPIAGAVLALLAIGLVGSLLLSTEMWWSFRLTREPNNSLRVRRGLLTTRSVSLEERRLHGIELAEPLLLRWAGASRLHAVATGLKASTDSSQPDSKVLLPPAPRSEATRVAGEVLGTAWPPPGVTRLAGHPRAALRRRLLRSLLGPCSLVVALVVVASVTSWIPWWSWIPALVTIPVALAFAVDAYRGLGHGLDAQHLVTRCGTGVRRTVVLRRDGVIGWRIRRSPLQRRAGLATVSATTAAGSGAYPVLDVGFEEGLLLAEEAVPGSLEPFLVRPHRERR